MIDPKAPAEEKLAHGRKHWERLRDHYEDSQLERRTSARFYHNTAGKGQWDASEIEYLEEEGRPVLAFNLIKPKVEAILGMLADVRQKPHAVGMGGEDDFAADVMNALLEAVRKQLRLPAIEGVVAERGFVEGEGDLHLDVEPDPERPAFIRFRAQNISNREIQWDLASEMPDRSDAQVFTWDRWYTKGEFRKRYPKVDDEQIEAWLKGGGDALGEGPEESVWDEDRGEAAIHFLGDRDYFDEANRALYFDRRKGRLRVIHIEYTALVQRWFLVDDQGNSDPIPDELLPLVRQAKEEGLGFEHGELVSVWATDTYWLEFVRDHVLYDAPTPQPWDGYGVEPFSCYIDWMDNTAYGQVRNLVDPQREVNKSKSQELDHNISQGKPGWIAEEDSVPDQDTFEADVNAGGSVAIVRKGALTGQEVRERQVPEPSRAAAVRAAESMNMFDRVAGLLTEYEQASRGQEAYGTVMMRYHRSVLGLQSVVERYNEWQQRVAAKIIRGLQVLAPDPQIAEMLGNETRFAVVDGRVIELEDQPAPGAAPGMQRGRPRRRPTGRFVDLRDFRGLRFDVDLETSHQNTMLRSLELESLGALRRMGVAVDEELMVEKAVHSRYERERLKQHARNVQRSQAQMAGRERALLERQVDMAGQAQMAELQEESRRNRAKEVIDAERMALDFRAKLLATLEKADAQEKQWILALLAQIDARHEGRTQAHAGNG